jgi:hypothetical protein
MIAAASATATGNGFSSGGAIAVDRPSGKRAFNVLVVPASRDIFLRDRVSPTVIVFVIDPEVKTNIASEVLAKIYGLTRAECRVAERLIRGDTLVQAAAARREPQYGSIPPENHFPEDKNFSSERTRRVVGGRPLAGLGLTSCSHP